MKYGGYPGSNQPGWWTTATSNTLNVSFDPSCDWTGRHEPRRKPVKKDATNVGWLRERVAEICALAELEIA